MAFGNLAVMGHAPIVLMEDGGEFEGRSTKPVPHTLLSSASLSNSTPNRMPA